MQHEAYKQLSSGNQKEFYSGGMAVQTLTGSRCDTTMCSGAEGKMSTCEQQ